MIQCAVRLSVCTMTQPVHLPNPKRAYPFACRREYKGNFFNHVSADFFSVAIRPIHPSTLAVTPSFERHVSGISSGILGILLCFRQAAQLGPKTWFRYRFDGGRASPRATQINPRFVSLGPRCPRKHGPTCVYSTSRILH
jgi:hypothetical protein